MFDAVVAQLWEPFIAKFSAHAPPSQLSSKVIIFKLLYFTATNEIWQDDRAFIFKQWLFFILTDFWRENAVAKVPKKLKLRFYQSNQRN